MKDIILIIGPLASGKTFTVNYLQKKAEEQAVLYEKKVLSDAQTVIENMKKDDDQGGFYHYHAWCLGSVDGHSHTNGEPTLPMIFYGNKIVDAMYRDLFTTLDKLSYTGKLRFVEFAGGINTNSSEKLEFHINYSLTRLGKMLEKGAFPNAWMDRIHAVIHPKTDFDLRLSLNKKKKKNEQNAVEKGLVSAFNVESTMKVTGKDDFTGIAEILKKANVENIFEVENTGNALYEKKLDVLAKDIFSPFQLTPIRKKYLKKDIVLIVGRNNSGKKTILRHLYKLGQKGVVPHHNRFISDFDIFLRKVREDDRRGGFNHYHDWCLNKSGGHTHAPREKEIPFIITNNILIEESFGEFFKQLTDLPQTGKLWFVEWSGGINLNPSYEPSSTLDISFQTLGRFLQKGTYSTDWLRRISTVIHPIAEDKMRANLDESDSIEVLEKIKHDSVSSLAKDRVLFDIYGKDDFFAIEKFFHESDVRHMLHFEFDNRKQLVSYADNIGNMIFAS